MVLAKYFKMRKTVTDIETAGKLHFTCNFIWQYLLAFSVYLGVFGLII